MWQIQTHKSPFANRLLPLNKFLEPVNTGSSQGTIEELEAQLEACKGTIGHLLAHLAMKEILTVREAMEIANRHRSYSEYKDGPIKIMKAPGVFVDVP